MKERDSIDVDTLLSITVSEYASPLAHYAEVGDKLSSVLEMMNAIKIRHVPVMENGVPVGIISQRDVNTLRLAKNFADIQVEHAMIKDPYIVGAEEGLDEVLEEMSKNKYGCVLVEHGPDDFPRYGILTTIDVMNAFVSVLRGDLPEKGVALDSLDEKPGEEGDAKLEDIDLSKSDYETNIFPEI